MSFLNKKRNGENNEEMEQRDQKALDEFQITGWNYYERKEDYKQRYKRFIEAKVFLLKYEKETMNPILSYTAAEGRKRAEQRREDMKMFLPCLKKELMASSKFLKKMKEKFLTFQKENEENLDFSNDSEFEDEELELNNFKKRFFKKRFFKNYGKYSFFNDFDYSYKKNK